MSSYQNYDESSRNYDETREPIGVGIILGCLALGPTRLDQTVLLDAGCGTGSYAQALLKYVRRIEAVDLNRGMIAKAAEKLKKEEAEARITFKASLIAELPQENRSVDAVMVNQVLHHLADDPEKGYPAHRQVVKEFHRVLRPGGVLVINTCSQEQLKHSFWFFDLVPEAGEKVRARCIPLDTLAHLIQAAGFKPGGRIVPTDKVLQGKAYFDPRGPLNKAWRDGDSTWGLVTPDELNRACGRIRDMEVKGMLPEYFARLDAKRPEIGQITFLYAIR